MTADGDSGRRRSTVLTVLFALLVIGATAALVLTRNASEAPPKPDAGTAGADNVHSGTVVKGAVVEFDGNAVSPEMEKRKAEMGVGESVDMIVTPEESIRLGDQTVPMGEILDTIRMKKGDFVEKDLSGKSPPQEGEAYGIYVVRPGDNIWNIHFRFLKDYFAQKDLSLSETADEPLPAGTSSGVGKLLKFSETMVMMYNVLERRIDNDLNRIEPLTKIVVYNMKEVYSLLDRIEPDEVDRVRFDGEAIWIPAE